MRSEDLREIRTRNGEKKVYDTEAEGSGEGGLITESRIRKYG